jgi:hypothetical protein
MRRSGVVALVLVLFVPSGVARAVEEGQFIKKEGKWEYYSGEDPGLKYLYMKGIITK